MEQGYSLNEVGRMVGCAPSSVTRWRDALQAGGEGALKVRFSPGRPPRLSAAQRQRTVRLLLRGALANRFSSELWTTGHVATLIHQHCRERFHRSHVARLLHELGFSCQKPERRALERDEARIEQWKRQDWPRIKKHCAAWANTPK